MQLDRHPLNSRSKFSSTIDINNLDFLGDDPIEVAIKSILLDTDASHNVIESVSEIPDIVLVHEINRSDSVLDIMQIGGNNVMTEFGANEVIEYENKAYIFDERPGLNEFGTKALTVHDYHTGFSSVNFIFDSDESSTKILQLLFIQRIEISSLLDLEKWLESIFRNIIFKFKRGAFSAAYLGENLVKYLSARPGNKKKTVKRLVDLTNIHPEVINKNENVNKFLMRVINYDYILVDKKAILKSEESLLKPMLLGLRSNISQHTIRNNVFDQIVAAFNIANLSDVKEIEFKNPIFYPTTKEKLSKATFEIIDFLTNSRPYFDVGNPTIINCIIRKKMKKSESFAILLDSSCRQSKNLYEDNDSMNFKIELAERINIPENWGVSLKSLFLTNNLYNVTSNKFFISYKEEYGRGDKLPLVEHGPPTPGKRMPDRFDLNPFSEMYEYHINGIPLKSGCYKSISEIVDQIQKCFEENHIRFRISFLNNKIVAIKSTPTTSGGTFTIKFSPYLSFVLGLSNDIETGFEHSFKGVEKFRANYETRLKMLSPKYVIVCADIVDETIFSGQHVKLLKILVNVENNENEILNFDFLHYDVKDVKIREFSSIQITITDITGSPLITDSIIPTILQLEFSNQSHHT